MSGGSQAADRGDGLLECVELQTHPSPGLSIVWLHGLGADGYDFVPIVRELQTLGAPPARYVFPHAPERPVTVNGGFRMRAWYDVLGTRIDQREDDAGIRQSQAQVQALIEREAAHGVARSRIVLAGFSQGGAIALQTGLRQNQKLGALVVLSAYLPLADSAAAESSAAGRSTPIFMAHGTQDGMIPIQVGRTSSQALAALGCSVQWHEYAMAHSVCEDELRDLARFLSEALK